MHTTPVMPRRTRFSAARRRPSTVGGANAQRPAAVSLVRASECASIATKTKGQTTADKVAGARFAALAVARDPPVRNSSLRAVPITGDARQDDTPATGSYHTARRRAARAGARLPRHTGAAARQDAADVVPENLMNLVVHHACHVVVVVVVGSQRARCRVSAHTHVERRGDWCADDDDDDDENV